MARRGPAHEPWHDACDIEGGGVAIPATATTRNGSRLVPVRNTAGVELGTQVVQMAFTLGPAPTEAQAITASAVTINVHRVASGVPRGVVDHVVVACGA
jgi:hypothetical protein